MEDKEENKSGSGIATLIVIVIIWLGLCGMGEGYGFFEGIFQTIGVIIKIAGFVLLIWLIYLLIENNRS